VGWCAVNATHVLLWSQRENRLRVDLVEDMLSANRSAYREDAYVDFLPLCLGSKEQCVATMSNLLGTIASRTSSTKAVA
jgi:hypothetical protein